MARWEEIGPGINLDSLDSLIGAAGSTLEGLSAILNIIAEALNVIAFLLSEPPNVIEAIVSEAVAAIEQAILDILENNIAFAVHLNTRWDPDWKYERQEGDDPGVIPDYINDGALPLIGTGIRGWLLDLAYSSYDPTDPLRPLTDESTAVTGTIIVNGVTADGDLQELSAALRVLTDYARLEQALEIKDSLENATQAYKDLLRMGPAALSSTWKSLSEPDALLKGTLIASGTNGTNDADSDFFRDATTFTDPNVPPMSDIELGDYLKFSTSPRLYEVLEIVAGVTPSIRVDPPIAADNSSGGKSWEVRRGGVNGLIAALPEEYLEFRPVPGAYPKWVSTPLAAAIPGLNNLFEGLRKLVNLLKVGNNHAAALSNLALVLKEKVRQLEDLIDELTELLDLVQSLIDFFESAYIIQISTESGGMAEFVNTAMSAEGIPEFGDRGAVIGVTYIATSSDPANQFENFMGTIGLQLDAYSDSQTERVSQLKDTWDDEFSP